MFFLFLIGIISLGFHREKLTFLQQWGYQWNICGIYQQQNDIRVCLNQNGKQIPGLSSVSPWKWQIVGGIPIFGEAQSGKATGFLWSKLRKLSNFVGHLSEERLTAHTTPDVMIRYIRLFYRYRSRRRQRNMAESNESMVSAPCSEPGCTNWSSNSPWILIKHTVTFTRQLDFWSTIQTLFLLHGNQQTNPQGSLWVDFVGTFLQIQSLVLLLNIHTLLFIGWIHSLRSWNPRFLRVRSIVLMVKLHLGGLRVTTGTWIATSWSGASMRTGPPYVAWNRRIHGRIFWLFPQHGRICSLGKWRSTDFGLSY